MYKLIIAQADGRTTVIEQKDPHALLCMAATTVGNMKDGSVVDLAVTRDDGLPALPNVYSCRFEYSHDYTTFVVAANKRGVTISTSELHLLRIAGSGTLGPDTYVEFHAETDLETLRDILRNCQDLHVGLQTLKAAPMKDNRMERDYNIQ